MADYFLQHANTWNQKDTLYGRYLSEKIDGMRCFWDGGYSIGKLAKDIVFANVALDTKDFECTGLWSRQRKVINAPKWFTDLLPRGVCLDGELVVFGPDGTPLWDQTISACRKHVPVSYEWERVRYCIFDSPEIHTVLPPNWRFGWARQEYNWFTAMRRLNQLAKDHGWNYSEGHTSVNLQPPHPDFGGTGWCVPEKPSMISIMPQILLGSDWKEYIEARLAVAHEGLMARGTGDWAQKRSSLLLKIKKYEDGEATIIGYQAGAGKYEDMLGSLTCSFKTPGGVVTVNMSGMTDEMRQLTGRTGFLTPGTQVPEYVRSTYFKRGQVVNFQYRYLSAKDGVPVEPRFKRIRDTMD